MEYNIKYVVYGKSIESKVMNNPLISRLPLHLSPLHSWKHTKSQCRVASHLMLMAGGSPSSIRTVWAARAVLVPAVTSTSRWMVTLCGEKSERRSSTPAEGVVSTLRTGPSHLPAFGSSSNVIDLIIIGREKVSFVFQKF